MYDSPSGKILKVFDDTSLSYGMKFSADNRSLVVAECSDIAHIYDVATGSLIRSLQQPEEPVCTFDVAFSPDGTQIVTADYGGT